jgi:hypothetical protein
MQKFSQNNKSSIAERVMSLSLSMYSFFLLQTIVCAIVNKISSAGRVLDSIKVTKFTMFQMYQVIQYSIVAHLLLSNSCGIFGGFCLFLGAPKAPIRKFRMKEVDTEPKYAITTLNAYNMEQVVTFECSFTDESRPCVKQALEDFVRFSKPNGTLSNAINKAVNATMGAKTVSTKEFTAFAKRLDLRVLFVMPNDPHFMATYDHRKVSPDFICFTSAQKNFDPALVTFGHYLRVYR